MSAEPKPSATLVVIRDAGSDLEVLLLQRSPRRDGRPGAWVFPGGKIDPADHGDGSGPVTDAARRAAVRETHEEAGLVVRAEDLVPISRWITPEIASRRFDTWFFATAAPSRAEVRVDGSEICHHRWLSPAAALDAHERGDIPLAPPTFVTVTWLTEHERSDAALAALAAAPLVTFRPRICRTPEGACILYPGDAGYEAGKPEHPGARHRLVTGASSWHYERSGGA